MSVQALNTLSIMANHILCQSFRIISVWLVALSIGDLKKMVSHDQYVLMDELNVTAV